MKQNILNLVAAHRKLAAVCLAVVICAGGAGGFLLYWNGKEPAQAQTAMRQYTVQKGDVTVGVTESGTITLTKVSVTFPVAADVDAVLVKAGYTVEEGDPLLQLDPDSIADGSAESRTKLDEAKLALEKAIADQSDKLKEAKLTYETSKAGAAYAPAEQEAAKAELQNSITAAQTTLQQAQEDLKKYTELQKNDDSSAAKLKELKAAMEQASDQKTASEKALSDFETDNATAISRLESLESDRTKAKAALDYAKAELAYLEKEYDEDEDDATDYQEDYDTAEEAVEKAQYEYNVAKQAYNTYSTKSASGVAEKHENLKSQSTTAAENAENAEDAYNDYKETYDEDYKITGTELDRKVISLEADVKTAQVNLEKLQKTSGQTLLEADQKLQTSLNQAGSAQSVYDLTVQELQQAVESQQSAYDTLQKQMEDLESVIAGNGVITSPCSGVVSSVSYSAGDTVEADQAIVTIAKTTELSMAFSLAEEDITDVTIGQEAAVVLSAYEDETFDAKVDSISAEPARSGSASVSYTVTVKLDGENDKQVLEGMSGDVTLIQKRVEDVLYVSNRAITFDNGASTVLVSSADGGQETREVETGFSNGTYVEIVSGLSEGDTVLAESAVSAT